MEQRSVCLLVVADKNTLKVQRVSSNLVWLEYRKLLQTLGTTAEIKHFFDIFLLHILYNCLLPVRKSDNSVYCYY